MILPDNDLKYPAVCLTIALLVLTAGCATSPVDGGATADSVSCTYSISTATAADSPNFPQDHKISNSSTAKELALELERHIAWESYSTEENEGVSVEVVNATVTDASPGYIVHISKVVVTSGPANQETRHEWSAHYYLNETTIVRDVAEVNTTVNPRSAGETICS